MKLQPFQRFLGKEGIDLAIIGAPDPTITYFTQQKFSAAQLAISPSQAALYVSTLDPKPAQKECSVLSLKKGWLKELQKEHPHPKVLGINKEQLSVASLERFQKTFPHAKIKDVGEEISRLRSQKTAEEIRRIKRACTVTTNALQELLPQLEKKKVRTEQDVAFFLEKSMREHGAEVAFPSIVAFGKNAAIPHHQTSRTPLRKGLLLLDFGASYKNYCADMTRMLSLGKPSREERQRYAQLLAVQQDAIRSVKNGQPYAALEKGVRKNLGNDVSYFIHSLGHGLGVEVHEAPSFSEEKKQKVQQNHVFTIEPGMYFPQKFGLRIEDTILFDGKTKVLTKAAKELIKL
ncbi:MAG: Xaa-Pro peptidase family protein [Nanoarchaeota archaeon]|nr:Xaa-Pro peptidase family protein [Nanoarchaeota archaeon]